MSNQRDYRIESMTSDEVAALWERLRRLFERHFGLEPEYNVLAAHSDATFTRRLRVMYSGDEPVGAVLVRGFETSVEHVPTVIFRAAACVDPGFRDRTWTIRFLNRVVLGYRVRRPWRRVYYVDPIIHPSSFLVIHRHIVHVYPTLTGYVPARVEMLFQSLRRSLLSAYDFSCPDPYVCRIQFNTRESVAESEAWKRRARSDRYVRRFEASGAAEPDRGLLCIVPIDLPNMLLSLPWMLFSIGGRILRRWLGSGARAHSSARPIALNDSPQVDPRRGRARRPRAHATESVAPRSSDRR
jgi:hypothetical protein